MAATYSMGQYRFSGAVNTVSSLPTKVSEETINTNGSNSEGSELNSSYQKDVSLSLSDGTAFEQGKDYYAFIKIPQDLNYDIELTLKLIKDTDDEKANYQYLRTIEIPRGGTGQDSETVVLYETEIRDEINSKWELDAEDNKVYTEEVFKLKAMIPEQIPFTVDKFNLVEIPVPGDYQDKIIDQNIYQLKEYTTKSDNTKVVKATYYYLGYIKEDGSKGLKKWDKYNDVVVAASWRQGTTQSFVTYTLIFRPVEAGFTKLLLQMTRSAEDYNIERNVVDETTGTVITEYGRKLDITKMTDCKFYEVKNLMATIGKSTLTKIGVWGHPELMLAINGEEIKIGPSGYYELDAIKITSLGVAALSYKDMFSIDYQYLLSE